MLSRLGQENPVIIWEANWNTCMMHILKDALAKQNGLRASEGFELWLDGIPGSRNFGIPNVPRRNLPKNPVVFSVGPQVYSA